MLSGRVVQPASERPGRLQRRAPHQCLAACELYATDPPQLKHNQERCRLREAAEAEEAGAEAGGGAALAASAAAAPGARLRPLFPWPCFALAATASM